PRVRHETEEVLCLAIDRWDTARRHTGAELAARIEGERGGCLAECTCRVVIGRPRRGKTRSPPAPGPPFKPCVRISRTRLTDGLSNRRITQPPGIGWSRSGGRAHGRRRRRSSTVQPRQRGERGPYASP